jgi:hypothetical protein
MGKSKSQSYPNGLRKVEKTTGKELAPRSLRHRHRYENDCSDAELQRAKVKRTEK